MSFSPPALIEAARGAVAEFQRVHNVRIVHAALAPASDPSERAGPADKFALRVAFVRPADSYFAVNSVLQNSRGTAPLSGPLSGVRLFSLDVRDAFAGALQHDDQLSTAAISPWLDHFQSDVITSNPVMYGLLSRVVSAGPHTRAQLGRSIDRFISISEDGLDSLRHVGATPEAHAASASMISRIYGLLAIKAGIARNEVTQPADLPFHAGVLPVGVTPDALRSQSPTLTMMLMDHLPQAKQATDQAIRTGPLANYGIADIAAMQFGAVAATEGPDRVASMINADVARLIREAPGYEPVQAFQQPALAQANVGQAVPLELPVSATVPVPPAPAPAPRF